MSIIESVESQSTQNQEIINEKSAKSLIVNESDRKEEEYDPNNGADQEQAVKDADDDIYDDDDNKDNAEKEEEDKTDKECQELEFDEDKIINSENFEKEFIAAIESVQKAAKFDREILLKKVYEAYEEETGEQATDQMIVDAFKSFVIKEKEQENEEEEEEVDAEEEEEEESEIEIDASESEENENEIEISEEEEYGADIGPEEFEKEMNLALDNVRKLASKHQEEFVDIISETFAEFNNGEEPTINDISAIFNRIKQNFADEAADNFLDCIDEENDDESEDDEDSDSDYDENDIDDIQQYEDDEDIDFENDEDEEEEYDEEADSDYDPENESDEEQGDIDFDDDIYNEQEHQEHIESDQNEEEEQDEDTIINSWEFKTEFCSAIESVQIAAKYHQQQIFDSVQETFEEETGEQATDDMIVDAFKTFIIQQNDNDINDESNDNDVDPEEFEKEMNMALENVTKLGQQHQEEFVNKISEIYAENNGDEPTANDLSEIFGEIKAEFADEAAQDFLECNEYGNEEQEYVELKVEDYIKVKAAVQAAQDFFNNFDDEEEDEEDEDCSDSEYESNESSDTEEDEDESEESGISNFDEESVEEFENEEEEEEESADSDYDENNAEDVEQEQEDNDQDYEESDNENDENDENIIYVD